jgi:hypothetical protein
MIGACLRIVDQIGTQVEIADFAPRRLASGKFGQAGMPGQGRQGKLNPMLGASQHWFETIQCLRTKGNVRLTLHVRLTFAGINCECNYC